MSRNLKSILCGATVAALVIVPSVPGMSQGMAPHAPPAPAAPPAPPAPPHSGDWTTAPVRNFNTTSLKVEDVVGTLTVAVRDNGPMVVEVSGTRERVGGVHVSQDGGRLMIDCDSYSDEDNSVWDWRNWFNFPKYEDRHGGTLFVKVTVPRGTNVNVQDLVGDANIGDTMGDLHFEAATSRAHIGHVSKARIEVGGAGRIDIAGVTGDLSVDMGGSGRVTVGSAGSVRADLAGSADADFGQIAGGLKLDIAGSGDVTAAHVNGPTSIDVAGSSTVRIADGIANPLRIDIMGAGNVYFGGVAVDPHIDAVGSGTVHIKAYRGHLSSEGMAEVKIGD